MGTQREFARTCLLEMKKIYTGIITDCDLEAHLDDESRSLIDNAIDIALQKGEEKGENKNGNKKEHRNGENQTKPFSRIVILLCGTV